jgi:Cys-rich four helix bundle protein (predicted Tat secretion target)
MNTSMNRRDALVATATGLAAFSAVALAQPKAAAPKKADASAAANPYAALVEAVDACIIAGETCLQHCIAKLTTGDTMLAECTGTVRAMLPLCRAMAELGRQNSTHAKALAAVCAKACRDCEKACQKHATMHAECKACMESCQKCAAECEKAAA